MPQFTCKDKNKSKAILAASGEDRGAVLAVWSLMSEPGDRIQPNLVKAQFWHSHSHVRLAL